MINENNSAIVLLSGGQDSATCLAIAKQEYNYIHCICFDYGQRHRIEINASQQLAKKANSTFQLIDIRFVNQLSNSALTNHNQGITTLPNGLPSTFVPGRNALFLTISSMIAYKKSIKTIFTGVCQTDYSGYPDCRQNFIDSQKNTLTLAMDHPIDIKTPLMHLTKADTVRLMNDLGCLDWYALTHTCYEGQQPACGVCPACELRLNGFKEAGVNDPIDYIETVLK